MALAVDGLGLIRLEPRPSYSPPCQVLSTFALLSRRLKRPTGEPCLPRTPGWRRNPRVGAPGPAAFHTGGAGFRPPRPFRAPPRACGSLSPRRPRLPARAWRVGSSEVRGRARSASGAQAAQAGPAGSRPCTCRLPPTAPLPPPARPAPEGSACPPTRRTERGRRQRDVQRGGQSGGGAERGSGKRPRRRGRRGGAARGGQRLTAACGASCCPPWAEAAADGRQARRRGKPRAQPSRAHRAQRPGLRAMGRAGGGGPSRGPPPALLLLGATLVLIAGAVPGRYPPRPQPALAPHPCQGSRWLPSGPGGVPKP